jgi:putative serine protease PepD
MASGTEVTLTVVRDGKALDVPVTLATKTEDATSNEQGSDGTTPGQGSDGTAPGQGTLPGSESPNNVPDFSDLFPGQNG